MPGDIGAAGQIWLEASLKAHDFVPAEFWHDDHKVMVNEMIPGSHAYVHETDGVIDGFVMLGSGTRANFMGALFVVPDAQGQGIGTQLLDHMKAMYESLKTSVYQQNSRTFAFYQSRGFRVTGESVCELTGCAEYQLEWTASAEKTG